MTIEEAISSIELMPENGALVAKPTLTWASEAMFVELTDGYGVPQAILNAGYEIVLDREDLEYLLSFTKSKRMSGRSIAEFIIHYVMYDAYPEWFNDIPDLT